MDRFEHQPLPTLPLAWILVYCVPPGEAPMFDDDEISEARSQDASRGKKTPRSLQKEGERLSRIMLYAIAKNKRELFSRILVKIGSLTVPRGISNR